LQTQFCQLGCHTDGFACQAESEKEEIEEEIEEKEENNTLQNR
jgi:hypothetical protein